MTHLHSHHSNIALSANVGGVRLEHLSVGDASPLAVMRKREDGEWDGEDEVKDEYDGAGDGAVARVAKAQLQFSFS